MIGQKGIDKLYLGCQEISTIYLGKRKIWPDEELSEAYIFLNGSTDFYKGGWKGSVTVGNTLLSSVSANFPNAKAVEFYMAEGIDISQFDFVEVSGTFICGENRFGADSYVSIRLMKEDRSAILKSITLQGESVASKTWNTPQKLDISNITGKAIISFYLRAEDHYDNANDSLSKATVTAIRLSKI